MDLLSIDFTDAPLLTEQHHVDQANINSIVARGFPELRPDEQTYANLPASQSLKEAYDQFGELAENFDELPAKIRQRFQHDPFSLLAFIQDDRNIDEAPWLGLIHETPPIAPEAQEEPSKPPPEVA